MHRWILPSMCGLVALCLVAASRNVAVVTPDADGRVVINTSELDVAMLMVTRDILIADPLGSKWPKQLLQLDVSSDKPYAVTWGPKFKERYAARLPKLTSGPFKDFWGFQYDVQTDTWDVVVGAVSPARAP